METAGMEDIREDAESNGLGTPATRAGILHKPVKVGMVERKCDKKTKHLLPTQREYDEFKTIDNDLVRIDHTSGYEKNVKFLLPNTNVFTVLFSSENAS